ncbi:MAG: hypothetical protein P4M05_30355 [Bradyrhizobium sp.]|nr:hypothetical protein [Bradyrhizobium sp.]
MSRPSDPIEKTAGVNQCGTVSLKGRRHVSSPQQLFCSFAGTTFLIRSLVSVVEVSRYRGERAFSKASNFEPGRPPDIARRPFQFSPTGA